jgi:hypothetical protein
VSCCVVPSAVAGLAGEIAMEVNWTAVPFPCNVAVCCPPLSVTVSVPLLWPETVGVKVTLITQLAPAASAAGQELAEKGPVAETLVTLSVVVWLLIRLIVWAGLVVPTT